MIPPNPPNDWNALHALESLEDPFSVFNITDEEQAFMATLGEIPIILHCGILIVDDSGDRSTSSEGSLDLPHAISNACSEMSINSCGTFGPMKCQSSPRVEYEVENEACDVEEVGAPDTTLSACSTLQYLSPYDHDQTQKTLRRPNSTSILSSSSYMSTQTEQCATALAQPRSATSLALLSTSHSVFTTSARPSFLRSRSTETLSTTSRDTTNPRSGSPSALLDPSFSWSTVSAGSGFLSPSGSSYDVPPPHGVPPATLQGVNAKCTRRVAIPRSPAINGGKVNVLQVPGPRRTRTISNDTHTSGSSTGSGKSASSVGWHEAAHLPNNLSWLEKTVAELIIDQEGFRSAHPQFKPSGFTAANGKTMGVGMALILTDGLVELRPIKRYIFAFHHATLESPPALRQLMIAGEDSKDHLSRQASLIIKQNGVYVVRGCESSDFTYGSITPAQGLRGTGLRADAHLKYEWRFEYVVNDRRDSNGRPIAGEKIFTPISFACSPGLLHPTYGSAKKTTIMQQVKKTFAAKVTSERMQAPPPPNRQTTQTSDTAVANSQRDHSSPPTAKPTHRRFHSVTSAVAIPAFVMSHPGHAEYVPPCRQYPIRRETAPSDLEPIPSADVDRRRSLTSPVFKVVRHIVPPAELDDLIAAPVPTPQCPPSTTPQATTALSPPRPRHHAHHNHQYHQKTTGSGKAQEAGAHGHGARHGETPNSVLSGRPKATVLRRLSWRG